MNKFNLKEHITNQVINNLEKSGKWVAGHTQLFHRNIDSKQNYTGINPFLLNFSMVNNNFKSNIWGTFNQFSNKGGRIRKGSKSTMIIFYKSLNIKDQDTDEEKQIPMMRYYRVFNTDQIEGLEIKSDAPRQVRDTELENNILFDYMKKERIELESTMTIPAYAPLLDKIFMPSINQYNNDNNYLHTLAHECIHSTGHDSRLKRELSSMSHNSKIEYSQEELIAELGALFIDSEIGTKSDIRNSAAYISGWCKYLKDNKDAIFSASSKAYKAYEYIINK